MNDRRLEQRVAAVAEAALSEHGFVTAINVFLGLGRLAPSSEQAWRQGRTPCLERVVTAKDHHGDAVFIGPGPADGA
jgi:hypothetical protein